MNHYPLMVDLYHKRIIVVGGGKVASRKIQSFLQAGADIIVVSSEVSPLVAEWEQTGRLIWWRKRFSPDDISSAFIVIAATNKKEVNAAIAKAASPHQLVNVADQPELGNFHTPSVLNQGRLTIAVSTNGASPTLARHIRDNLFQTYDETYDTYLDFLFTCRERIKQEDLNPEQKQKILKDLLDPKYKQSANQRKVMENFYFFIRQLAN